MKVFVTGATGYIGSAVAAAIARAGHEVFGLVRSAEHADRLAALEIRPVLGTMGEPASYRGAANNCQVLIHCAAEYSEKFFDLDRLTVETLLNLDRADRSTLVIYTSGAWVYGSTGDEAVDETSPVHPLSFQTARVEHERLVLGANGGRLRTVVLRPGCVYGGRGGLTALWFQSALRDGAASLVGDGSNRWAMIHVQDLADVYLRVVESPFGGEVFNATDRSRYTILDCARAASQAAGAGGKVKHLDRAEAARTLGPVAEGLALDQHVDSRKAVHLLGWQPRHGGFVDGAARCLLAWKASAH